MPVVSFLNTKLQIVEKSKPRAVGEGKVIEHSLTQSDMHAHI